ncbi:MAG: hypothetical protein Kow00129_11350 [Thermoleophilia bacterium]
MKKYDPLWQLVGIERPLEGVAKCVDARCPVCHVVLDLGPAPKDGVGAECGLCGAQLVVRDGDRAHLELASTELLGEDQEVPAEVQRPKAEISSSTE